MRGLVRSGGLGDVYKCRGLGTAKMMIMMMMMRMMMMMMAQSGGSGLAWPGGPGASSCARTPGMAAAGQAIPGPVRAMGPEAVAAPGLGFAASA